jgi:hypothetical protein
MARRTTSGAWLIKQCHQDNERVAQFSSLKGALSDWQHDGLERIGSIEAEYNPLRAFIPAGEVTPGIGIFIKR